MKPKAVSIDRDLVITIHVYRRMEGVYMLNTLPVETQRAITGELS
jgi:hypothetical protein